MEFVLLARSWVSLQLGGAAHLGLDVVDAVDDIVGAVCERSFRKRAKGEKYGIPAKRSSAVSRLKSSILASTSTHGATLSKDSAQLVTFGVPT